MRAVVRIELETERERELETWIWEKSLITEADSNQRQPVRYRSKEVQGGQESFPWCGHGFLFGNETPKDM